MKIKIKPIDDDLIPTYASDHSSGADLRANITEVVELKAGASFLVPTGLFLELPADLEAQIRPRSGLALNAMITILNSPGTIDADYRGEIKVILINHGRESFFISPKMKIAQLVISPIIRAEFIKVEKLISTKRGEGGFGHSGT